MPADTYQIVALDPEDIEDEVRSPKLAALRAQGFRVVATMAVEMRGRPRLAFIMEPPERAVEARLEVREAPAPAPLLSGPRAVALAVALAVFLVLNTIGLAYVALSPLLGR